MIVEQKYGIHISGIRDGHEFNLFSTNKNPNEYANLIETFINDNKADLLDKLKAADDYFADAFGVSADAVNDEDEIMLISSNGTLVRTPVEGISIVGRNTQGVTLIRLIDDQKLVGLARIEAIEQDDGADE